VCVCVIRSTVVSYVAEQINFSEGWKALEREVADGEIEADATPSVTCVYQRPRDPGIEKVCSDTTVGLAGMKCVK